MWAGKRFNDKCQLIIPLNLELYANYINLSNFDPSVFTIHILYFWIDISK